MKYINFGKVDKRYLIPIFDGIIMLFYYYFLENFPKCEIISQNPFIVNIYFSIGIIFAFIPHLILKYRIKKSTNNNMIKANTSSKLNIDLIYEDISENFSSKKFRYLLLSSVGSFLQILLFNLFSNLCVYNMWFFDIILISFISHLFLKTKIYRHQYFSMIIIIIFGFGLNIIEYFQLDEEENKINPFGIIMRFCSEFLFSLIVVISKYIMKNNYCSPYEFLMWDGIITIFFQIIALIVINIIGPTISDVKYPDNFFEYFGNFNIYDFIITLVIIIVAFGYNILLFLTCDIFTPFHILIPVIIEESYFFVGMEGNLSLNILRIIILILIVFMFLVFIEIIEINIYNLSYNTKKKY